jgi:methyltransferase (TIGR00027 family)
VADTLIENVSDTAFWVAHYRAAESERRDALFHDPLASRLSGERGARIAKSMPMSSMTGWVIAIRTTIIDDFVGSAIAGGVDTILNLGAGLDTRPYRMDLPQGLLWAEADYPAMVDYKAAKLSSEEPRCRIERVKIDLADLAQRRQMLSGINARATKLLVLTEGVIPYLTAEEVASLAQDLRGLDHLCCWITEYHSPEIVKYRDRTGLQQKLQNAPFKFRPDDWFGFFAERGWRPKEVRYLFEQAQRLHRPIELPFWMKAAGMIRMLVATKERREAFRKFSAYVVLAPAAGA